ncbi:uroporphyrinogen-III synthase [Methanobrevibacter filiformis]|uniref:Uroporphyrinogen-III synthase n=1 Tax=Methanobrevibacter filiformis TaxID=55758 RepID=A0A166DAA8_9EURY|nr:uroporphyrinogen-III synthase [Methanobrevibacter filiformis]KZX15373.1 uroporphyrinogen-III synthase [Methanobrevibacter filiformis]
MVENNNQRQKTIAITRPFNRINEAVELVKSYGAEPFIAPTLELELTNSKTLKKLINSLDKLDWIIFTSPTSIESILTFYPDFKGKLNENCKIGAIGSKTKESLEKEGLDVDLVPKVYTAEGIVESFKNIDISGKLIGIPRTLDARLILPEKLKEMGSNVLIAEAYRSRIPLDTLRIETLISKIIADEIDAITFTSPLTVKNLFKIVTDNQKDELINKLSTSTLTVAIGPITYEILNEYNISAVYPEKYTVKDMIQLLFETL